MTEMMYERNKDVKLFLMEEVTVAAVAVAAKKVKVFEYSPARSLYFLPPDGLFPSAR